MDRSDLDHLVLGVVKGAGKPLSIHAIVQSLVADGEDVDSFDVQKAVRRLRDHGHLKSAPWFEVEVASERSAG